MNQIVDSKMPQSLGEFILNPSEYCYCVYMPIKIGAIYKLPKNLSWVEPLLYKITDADCMYSYWYLTVKYMHVDGFAKRPGWHIDGYLSDDVNYIWSDNYPTQFCVNKFSLELDHKNSMKQMHDQAIDPTHGLVNHMYRLDNTIVHRTPYCKPGFRAFVKISCSNEKYNLLGNATNPELDLDCEYVTRDLTRNHPTK